MSMSYLSLIVVTMVIGMGASWYVNRQINKYLHVPASTRVTGAQMAEMMLAANGVHGVQVYRGGPQQDHFDLAATPSPWTLMRSAEPPSPPSPRHATRPATPSSSRRVCPMKIRGALVPAVKLRVQRLGVLLMFGIFMQLSGLPRLPSSCTPWWCCSSWSRCPSSSMHRVAALRISRPRASRRPSRVGRIRAARLRATYVAAALTSILQLLWLLQSRDE